MPDIRKDVLEIAVTFKREMRKAGKGFNFAKARDITNTYHYRWFNSFLDKCYGNDMNLEETKEVIKSVIVYAKEKRILDKGVSLISRSDIIEICLKRVEDDLKQTENSIAVIEKKFNELKKIDNLVRHLGRKLNRHGSVNFIIMRDNGKLTDSVTCLSKSCMQAYKSLSREDKNSLPAIREYILLNSRITNKIDIESLRDIFGDDLNV